MYTTSHKWALFLHRDRGHTLCEATDGEGFTFKGDNEGEGAADWAL